MSEPTIVALSILGLVSLLMTISLLRFGIDEAIRLWSVMGAVTGVAFGSITTYYFADKNRQAQVASYESKVSGLQTALADAKSKAALAQSAFGPYYAALRGDKVVPSKVPQAWKSFVTSPGATKEKMELEAAFGRTIDALGDIGNIKAFGVPASVTSSQ